MRISKLLKQAAFFWSNKDLNHMQTAHFQVARLDPGSKWGFSQFVAVYHCPKGSGNPRELLGVAGSWYVGRT